MPIFFRGIEQIDRNILLYPRDSTIGDDPSDLLLRWRKSIIICQISKQPNSFANFIQPEEHHSHLKPAEVLRLFEALIGYFRNLKPVFI